METYNFKSIESKWQKFWDDTNAYRVHQPKDPAKKFYCLVMFPYPSGKIHMGHARNYCIGDVIARYMRMRGYEVLHPLGWDAFGLPAENAAIERKIAPKAWTEQNIRDMREDIKSLGISYDWSREFATCDPSYYRWNQWFFIQMFKKGLAFRKKSSVNWCPDCKTVLANEQVHEGACWRCHSEVDQKDLDQWFFKITDYAQGLLDDLETLKGHWPDEVIRMQSNWIGRSEGAEITFKLEGEKGGEIKVFTTRPDTLFGCTFMVLAPENPILTQLCPGNEKVRTYCDQARKESRRERTAPEKEKTGVFSGLHAVNPVNGSRIPVWVADYVLGDYGTGAIMAVPSHDQRDFDFAKMHELPIIEVIRPSSQSERKIPLMKNPSCSPFEKGRNLGIPPLQKGEMIGVPSLETGAYEGDGTLVNSGEFNGLPSKEAAKKITSSLEKKGLGKASVTYRIRDWLISRQRYWGTPIPVVYCASCGIVPEKEENLPVLLPEEVEITGTGESPLSRSEDFVNTSCPQCGNSARRETDTMDTFVDSSWYFLRYCDPTNSKAPFDSPRVNDWMPVDQYIGGIEHACMHLIYSRFIHKVAADLGLVKGREPFQRLLTQGMVTLGGSAMSKSKGNVVPVEKMAKEFGADTARLFVLFASPPRNQLEWSDEGVQGAWRFLNRIWRMSGKFSSPSSLPPASHAQDLRRKTHQTIKKVEDDIERGFQFNTAIAALMELLNHLSDYPALGDGISREAFQTLITLLYLFAPHISSEIWERSNFEPADLNSAGFPSYDREILKESSVEIVIQVAGKLRAKISLPASDSMDEMRVMPLAKDALVKKGIPVSPGSNGYKFVPGKLINFTGVLK